MTLPSIVATLSAFLPVTLAAAIHGPIVQWYESPQHRASIRWIETAGGAGREGDWATGAGGFGYGDADDATVLRGMEGRYESVSIRRRLELAEDLPAGAELKLMARYDDAFVLWLDGEEKVRRNVRIVDGRERVIRKHEASSWEEIALGTVAELRGVSVIAATGYNDVANSSDFTLDLRLVAATGRGPREVIPSGAEWEYLAGSEPAAGWRETTGDRPPPARRDRVVFSYRTGEAEAWREVKVRRQPFAGTAHQVAFVELEDLPAGSEVEFRLDERSHRFRTAPEDAGGLRFVTGGDMFHNRELLDAMNARAGAEDPCFALLGGDLAYTNDVNHGRWFEWFDSWLEHARTPDGRLVPMVVAIGNHETIGAGYRPTDAPGPGGATEFFSLFGMPEEGEATQAIDFGDGLSLVLLDSGHAANVADQNDWLERQLAARESVKRLFACYHRPAWGCGTKENAVEIQKEWCPLFEKYRVDAVFENDHHVFSRSHPLVGGKRDDANGVPYLGAGAWGVGVRSVPERATERFPFLAAAEGANHLFVVEFGERGWVAIAKGADGRVIDRSQRPWRR